MGLLDKAKGLVESHRDEVEQHLKKVTDMVNKHAGGTPPAGTATQAGEESAEADSEESPEA
jgi:hypothetical protein